MSFERNALSPRSATAPSTTSTAKAASLERTAMARLAWALGRMLHMAARLHAFAGRDVPELAALEKGLAAATLPEEYLRLAKDIAALEIPTCMPVSVAGALAQIRRVLHELARAVAADGVVAELDMLRAAYEVAQSEDPRPLVEAGRKLVETIAVTRESSHILDEGLVGVEQGLHRLAQEDGQAEARLRTTRERVSRAGDIDDLEALRTSLLRDATELERSLTERRVALEALETSAASARKRAEGLLLALADATSAASTDALTGLGNRRQLEKRVEGLARTRPEESSVLVVDVDHFKQVNDTHGHGIGDRVLQHLAELLKNELRGDDGAFRVGGEEFVVVLARCPRSAALSAAERLRARVERTPVAVLGRALSITVSIGVASWRPGTPFEAAVARADAALYDAKRNGRNRCASSTP